MFIRRHITSTRFNFVCSSINPAIIYWHRFQLFIDLLIYSLYAKPAIPVMTKLSKCKDMNDNSCRDLLVFNNVMNVNVKTIDEAIHIIIVINLVLTCRIPSLNTKGSDSMHNGIIMISQFGKGC